MTELGYKESEWDRSFKPYTWDAAYRFSKGLAVSACIVFSLEDYDYFVNMNYFMKSVESQQGDSGDSHQGSKRYQIIIDLNCDLPGNESDW